MLALIGRTLACKFRSRVAVI